MPDIVGPPVTTSPPTTSETVGSWLFQDHISDEHKAALMRMAGLTVAPDVLHINGTAHEIQAAEEPMQPTKVLYVEGTTPVRYLPDA